MNTGLTDRQKQILEFIDSQTRQKGFPPTVREIGAAVGLTSPSTVHAHLSTLQEKSYLQRDPSRPRALKVCRDPYSGAPMAEGTVQHVPLVGDVAAGTDVLAHENIEESIALPSEFTGDGELFMLRVRGESMIEAGIFDGDFVVVNVQKTANNGDLVVAGIPGDESTIKHFRLEGDQVVLIPSNPAFEEMRFPAHQVNIFGRVVTVMRKV